MPEPKSNAVQSPQSGFLSKNLLDYLPLLLPLVGAVSLVQLAAAPLEFPWIFFAYAFLVFFIMAIYITLHELAHACVAARHGLFPIRIKLGGGKLLFRVRLKSLTVDFHKFLASGMVYPGTFAPTKAASIALFAAGPIMDLLVLSGLLLLLFYQPFRDWQNAPQLKISGLIAALVIGGSLLQNSITSHAFAHGDKFRTDIGNIIDMLKIPASVYSSLAKLTQTIPSCSKEPAQDSLLDPTKIAAYLSIDGHAELDKLRDLLCTNWLLTSSPQLDPFVDRISCVLLDTGSNEITRKGTRASVLMQLGKVEEGIPMLEEVLEKIQSPVDRQFSLGFLAIAHRKINQTEKARDYLERFHNSESSTELQKRVDMEFNDHLTKPT